MIIRRLEQIADKQGVLLPALQLDLPNPLIYTNIAEDYENLFRHRLLTANAARRFDQPEVALYRYRPGTLVDGEVFEPFATLTEGSLVRQQLPDWATDPEGLAASLAARGRDAPNVQAPCLLAARYGDVTWGHWLCEMLAKIVLAEAVAPQKFRFVVSARATTTGGPVAEQYVAAVLQSLLAYGIESHRLLRLPPGQAVAFDALFDISGVYPVPLEESFGMHPGLMTAMNEQLKSIPRASRAAKPFIVRGAGDLRQVANHADMLARARRHGYTPTDLAALDFAEQVSLFRAAGSVAGALGSGLTGMIFSPPDVELLTVAPADWPDNYFVNIFQKQDVRHADIRGTSSRAVRGDVGLSPFQVPLAAVDRGVELLRGGASLHHDVGAVDLGGRLFPRRLGAETFAVTFGVGGNATPFKRGGWAADEAKHTWSIGPACELAVPRARIAPGDCWLEALGFCFTHPEKLKLKWLAVTVNDEPLCDHSVGGQSRPAWLVPRDVLARQDPVIIRFSHPVCPSPQSFGVSPDDRALGFGFVRIGFFGIEQVSERKEAVLF